MGMTGHIMFPVWDTERCVTMSPTIIETIIRRRIGFDGLLMSDDLSMKALRGPMRDRASAAVRAGSDVALHCNGDLAEMRAVAEGVNELAGAAAARFARAFAVTRKSEDFDRDEALRQLSSLMSQGTQPGTQLV